MKPQTQLRLGQYVVVNLRSKSEYDEAITFFKNVFQIKWHMHTDFNFVSLLFDAPAGELYIKIHLSNGIYHASHASSIFYGDYHVYYLTDFQDLSSKGI